MKSLVALPLIVGLSLAVAFMAGRSSAPAVSVERDCKDGIAILAMHEKNHELANEVYELLPPGRRADAAICIQQKLATEKTEASKPAKYVGKYLVID
jgi:hypothetical protein